MALVGFLKAYAGEFEPRPKRIPTGFDGLNRDDGLSRAAEITGNVVLKAIHLRQQVPARKEDEGTEDEIENRERPKERDDVGPYTGMPQKSADTQRQKVKAFAHDGIGDARR